MALTREERQAIEVLIKKVRSLEDKVNTLEILNDALQKIVDSIDSESNILDWSSEQVDNWIKPYILKYLSSGGGGGIQRHNHTNAQQGGDCFAKLGASLIDGE
jgi:hypothetical protein